MKQKKYELNRNKYNVIRKMDHEQMRAEFEKVYLEGYRKGQEEQKPIDPGVFHKLPGYLKTIKGIGDQKAEQITEKVKEYLTEGYDKLTL